MRVLFLTNAYPDFDSSYRGIFIKKMAALLMREGNSVTVVTPKIYKGSHYFEEQAGIRIYRFPFCSGNKPLIEYKKIPYCRMILYYLSGFLFSIYALIKHKCHLIHIHWAIPPGPIGVLIGTVTRRPVVVTIHGSDFRLAMDRSSFLRKLFFWVCRRASHLHCVSGVMRREMGRLGIDEENISTFPMGVDQAFFEKGRNCDTNSRDSLFTVISNRNLLPIYNVSLLIRAIPYILKEEPMVEFIIAGGGPEREKLEKEVSDLNISSHVEFLGQVPHAEMSKLLSRANVYVSTSSYDGTSVSLLEAMASGVFPIVTDIPSNREWISDGENGFLVPLDQEKFLAEKIVEAIRNHDLRERSRDKNLCLIKEKALWPVTVVKTEEIYKKALESKS